jgi:hypothetical protein
MTPFENLTDCITTDTGISTIHGVGTFAVRDIKEGEKLFPRWKGDTGLFVLSNEEFSLLPEHSQRLVLKSYESERDKYPFVWFRLYKDCYFNLANPWVYVNTLEGKGNIDHVNRTASRFIKAGEEIIGTYKLNNTIL